MKCMEEVLIIVFVLDVPAGLFTSHVFIDLITHSTQRYSGIRYDVTLNGELKHRITLT